MSQLDKYHSFQVNVARNGVFLFRTEENNAAVRNKVLEEIANRFPASEGFEVSIVDWPILSGAYTIIHKPEEIACKGAHLPDDPKETS